MGFLREQVVRLSGLIQILYQLADLSAEFEKLQERVDKLTAQLEGKTAPKKA